MKKLLMILLPILVLALGIVGTGTMIALKAEPEVVTPVVPLPLVGVVTVSEAPYDFRVKSQGTVRPGTEIQLVPEVPGKVIDMASGFVDGGFFEKGQVLLKIDPFDYQQALVQARANLVTARLALAREQAESELEDREWETLGRGEKPALRALRLEQAEATVKAASARVASAERNLERTVLRAPFSGRVMEKQVDQGQFVAVGVPVARLYALDLAEVRLPLSRDDVALLDLPLQADFPKERYPHVLIHDGYGNRHQGRITRTEGSIDPRTRLIHAIAEVRHPYQADRVPLTVGSFVEAEIMGRRVERAVILPRATLRGKDRVLVVDERGVLHYRSLEVAHKTDEHLIVEAGLSTGDRVVLSKRQNLMEGARVRTSEPTGTTETEGGGL